MKIIEIVMIDHGVNNKVVVKVASRLKQLTGKKVIHVNPHESLLFQAIRLIRTYTAIPISKQAGFFLDVAKELQVREEIFNELPKDEDIIVLKTGSFLMTMFYYLTKDGSDVKKMSVKHVIKKFANPADLIVFAKMKFEFFKGKRRKFNSKYRVGDSLKGSGLRWRNIKYEQILGTLNTKYGTKGSIINSEDENLEAVIDEIIDVIKESGILGEIIETPEK